MPDIYRIQGITMRSIVDAIHEKNGESDGYTPLQMIQKIYDLQTEDPTAKPLIANAITAKGVPTQETDSWDTMALHIGQISGGSAELAGLIDGTATEIAVPDGVTSIRGYAFYAYTGLEKVMLPESLKVLQNGVFQNCIKLALTSLPSGITSIGANAFYNCVGITEMTFTGKPTTIAANAFQNCTKLLSIFVPWSEGEVANAPWGATNATIYYNHTP